MALAVPLSRFTSQVGGGSAFYVRPLVYVMITRTARHMVPVMAFGFCTEPVPVSITCSTAPSPFLSGHAERPHAAAPWNFQTFIFHFHFMFANRSQWPNKTLEPTADGVVSSAVAVHVVGRRWLSFFR